MALPAGEYLRFLDSFPDREWGGVIALFLSAVQHGATNEPQVFASVVDVARTRLASACSRHDEAAATAAAHLLNALSGRAGDARALCRWALAAWPAELCV